MDVTQARTITNKEYFKFVRNSKLIHIDFKKLLCEHVVNRN